MYIWLGCHQSKSETHSLLIENFFVTDKFCYPFSSKKNKSGCNGFLSGLVARVGNSVLLHNSECCLGLPKLWSGSKREPLWESPDPEHECVV